MRRDIQYRLPVMVLLVTLFLLGLTSCAQKRVATQTDVQRIPERTPQPVYRPMPPQQGLMEDRLRWEDAERNAFLNNRIYFEFDKYSIRPDAIPVLHQKADYMRNHPGFEVEIQGHCDERGTEAYNLALGDRRAHSTKKYLEDLGVERGRMLTASYGEEFPLVPGQNEQAWAQNRRVEFIITQR